MNTGRPRWLPMGTHTVQNGGDGFSGSHPEGNEESLVGRGFSGPFRIQRCPAAV